MITLNRDDRDLLVRTHRWAKANGWTYDATTLDHMLTDFRWRKDDTTVVVRMAHEDPSPWAVEVSTPTVWAELERASVDSTVAALAGLDVLPSEFFALQGGA